MATSLIGGLIKQGLDSQNIYISGPNQSKINDLAAELGVNACSSNAELVAQSKCVVIAVKPQKMEQVLTPLRSAFKTTKPLIISVAAGIRARSIQNWLGYEPALVRVMPNTPSLVGCGASGLFATDQVSTTQKADAEQLMLAVGTAEWVERESDIDAVTALSGSGPAYFMLFIQCLTDAATEAGLDNAAAQRLAVQTAAGTAELIRQSDTSLPTLIDNVTSPGGTTEQALLAFKEAGLTSTVRTAFDAAKRRAQALADELG